MVLGASGADFNEEDSSGETEDLIKLLPSRSRLWMQSKKKETVAQLPLPLK